MCSGHVIYVDHTHVDKYTILILVTCKGIYRLEVVPFQEIVEKQIFDLLLSFPSV